MNRLYSSKKRIRSRQFRMLSSAVLVYGLSFASDLNATPALSSSSEQTAFIPIKCLLEGSSDHFWFYQTQLVYQSDQFALFQNFKGRVVTQIDLKDGQFSRTTYIGDPFTPKHQTLFGRCQEPAHVLKLWVMSAVPFDQ